jgi:hypothetical protein
MNSSGPRVEDGGEKRGEKFAFAGYDQSQLTKANRRRGSFGTRKINR